MAKITQKQLDLALRVYEDNKKKLDALQLELEAVTKPFEDKVAKIKDEEAKALNPILAKKEAVQKDQDIQLAIMLQGVPENETIGRVSHKVATRKSVSYQGYADWLKNTLIPKTKKAEADAGVEQFTKTSITHKVEILEK